MDSAAAPEEQLGRSQTDVVIDGIKSMIMTGGLSAGSRLPVEKDLAAQLGVSRGSLREGVRALAILGVLETRQGDGTYVTALDARLLLTPMGFLADLQSSAGAVELLAVRRVLEAETAALAAVRMTEHDIAEASAVLDRVDAQLDGDGDPDLETIIDADSLFHTVVARASGNMAMAAIVESLVSRTFRARLWRAITEQGAVRHTQAEHRGILAELVARDPERARIRMASHILEVEEYTDSHAADAQ